MSDLPRKIIRDDGTAVLRQLKLTEYLDLYAPKEQAKASLALTAEGVAGIAIYTVEDLSMISANRPLCKMVLTGPGYTFRGRFDIDMKTPIGETPSQFMYAQAYVPNPEFVMPAAWKPHCWACGSPLVTIVGTIDVLIEYYPSNPDDPVNQVIDDANWTDESVTKCRACRVPGTVGELIYKPYEESPSE